MENNKQENSTTQKKNPICAQLSINYFILDPKVYLDLHMKKKAEGERLRV